LRSFSNLDRSRSI